MRKRLLGDTGLAVTEFCLGVLPMGPLQADLPVEQCVDLIRCAMDHGVNFLDTAEVYLTEKYIGAAVQGRRSDVIIASKSTVTDYDAMARSVAGSLRELDTSYIDIYHLHAARASENLFQERAGALRCLHRARAEKMIRAVGVATHSPAVAQAAAERDDIDVLFVLINQVGLGITGGTVAEMIQAVTAAHRRGKGVYAMKALAGGNLYRDPAGAFAWVRAIKGISSVAVGVISEAELFCNLSLFGVPGLAFDGEKLSRSKKLYISSGLCQGCEACTAACPNGALRMVDGKAKDDPSKCLLCGYCSPVCPHFAIRVI